MDLDIAIEVQLSAVIMKDGELSKRADFAMQAGMFMVEKAYVKEVPIYKSGFTQGIEVHKNAILDHVVKSTAKRKGRNYPLDLFTGTGKLRGASDYGFTTGHVRAGTVAYGIGGIRPNKAADRARKNVEKDYLNFVMRKLDLT